MNFKTHTRKPGNLFLKILMKKKIGFCENMDKFKNFNSHKYFCSILQLTNQKYLSLDFTKVLPIGLRAMIFPVMHDSSKTQKNLPGDNSAAVAEPGLEQRFRITSSWML